MAGAKTGQAKLVAAVKRLFSVTFDADEPLPETITVRRDDLECVLLCWKEQFTEAPEAPKMDPRQQ
jgi:hypothetical protein